MPSRPSGSGVGAARRLQAAVTFRSVMVATIVLPIFALFGDAILHSTFRCRAAGGIILLLFALDLVLGHGLPAAASGSAVALTSP